jgi:hypothetical protein
METQFRNLDRAIDAQPMPPQFQDTKAMVSCNDCYAKSAVRYHWLGLKCAICDSYNTAQLSILSDPEVDAPMPSMENDGDNGLDRGNTPNLDLLQVGPVPQRNRRHSSHTHSGPLSSRFSPYPLPQRIGRSVSPVRGPGFHDDVIAPAGETDDSGEEEDDDLDFWGRDEPRSVTSYENIEDMDEADDSEDDDASGADDCDEEGDDVDQFELFGHR